jgi:hypothetical protein
MLPNLKAGHAFGALKRPVFVIDAHVEKERERHPNRVNLVRDLDDSLPAGRFFET